MTVDSSNCAHTTLRNVWLPTSRTIEAAKNWTTAFPKVGTSKRCRSCSSKKKILTPRSSQLSSKIKVLASCPKSTQPAHHTCLSLVPPTVTHSPPEPLHTDLHSALTLPLSTNKTKISRAALGLGGGVPLADNTDYWGRIVAVWWWWLCVLWTLFQCTLISSAPHIVGEYGSIATSKEGSNQRNCPWLDWSGVI